MAPKIYSSRPCCQNLVKAAQAKAPDLSLIRGVRPARGSQVARLPCIWKENCSDQFISVDSKGSVAQCDCWVTSYPKYFFGNILREPGLTRMLKTSPVRRDFVERLPQREALLDALAFSPFSIGPIERSAQKIWRLRIDLTRHGSTKKMTRTIRFGDWWHRP